jgi:ribonuclease BN (tRNA processing enzyme)
MFSVRPIGVSAAFTLKGFNTNYLITGPKGSFLLDCGATAPMALSALGLSLTDVSELYLSHLHLDHVGGLIQLGLQRFSAGHERPRIYTHEDLAEKLWPLFLQGFIGKILGSSGKPERSEMSDFFELHSFPAPDAFSEKAGFSIAGIDCALYRGEHPAMSDSFGLVLNGKVLITSDTTFQPERLERVANHYQLETIFHHCTYNPGLSGMHATVEQLASLPEDLRELIILSHYDDHMLGKTDPTFQLAEAGRIYTFGETTDA